jgi:hypothetical protein
MPFPRSLAATAFFAIFSSALPGAEIKLTSPVDYQVVQRSQASRGVIRIAGELTGPDATDATIEARLSTAGKPGDWQPLVPRWEGARFAIELEGAAGGWYGLEVRAVAAGKVIASRSVEHVGIGEVFFVAGQSNSANYGEEKQMTHTGRVAAFDGERWQLANDPELGAGGRGGSFMPPLGDALVQRFGVPVGFVACGIGGSSVREWLPAGTTFPNPPTVETRVRKLPSGEWESKGEAFARLVERMKRFGPNGFRAVLWHQGESDANQQDPTRTLPGKLYREHLEKIIVESRREIGWEAPWFVAQASYHSPSDPGAPEIREAQMSLWRDGVALEGVDSDSIRGELREKQGQGVHFTGAGLRRHADLWMERIAPWLEGRLRGDSGD